MFHRTFCFAKARSQIENGSPSDEKCVPLAINKQEKYVLCSTTTKLLLFSNV